MKQFPDGTFFCTATIANSSYHQQIDGSFKEETSFFDIICKGIYAEAISKRDKGCFVRMEQGRVEQRKWIDKEGHSRSKIIFRAEKVRLSGRKTGDEADKKSHVDDIKHNESTDDSEIPF